MNRLLSGPFHCENKGKKTETMKRRRGRRGRRILPNFSDFQRMFEFLNEKSPKMALITSVRPFICAEFGLGNSSDRFYGRQSSKSVSRRLNSSRMIFSSLHPLCFLSGLGLGARYVRPVSREKEENFSDARFEHIK